MRLSNPKGIAIIQPSSLSDLAQDFFVGI
jgi:hypothetical protein